MDDIAAINSILGRNIRSARKAAGLSQGDLAVAIGCKRANISHIEYGRQCASFVQVCTIAQVLRVSLDDLYPPSEAHAPSPGKSRKAS